MVATKQRRSVEEYTSNSYRLDKSSPKDWLKDSKPKSPEQIWLKSGEQAPDWLRKKPRVYRVSLANCNYYYPLQIREELEKEFMKLVEKWHQETGMMSLVSKIVMHPAYQRIIGMGQPVIPLILRELEREPDHWFWALRAITGANPVKPEQQGRLKQMAQAWITWGKEHGYEW
jgi:hypothetical protein